MRTLSCLAVALAAAVSLSACADPAAFKHEAWHRKAGHWHK